jgi:hypothetical protein
MRKAGVRTRVLGLLDRVDPRNTVLADIAYDVDYIHNLIKVSSEAPAFRPNPTGNEKKPL